MTQIFVIFVNLTEVETVKIELRLKNVFYSDKILWFYKLLSQKQITMVGYLGRIVETQIWITSQVQYRLYSGYFRVLCAVL